MAYFVTRTNSDHTYYLSSFKDGKREWSAQRKDAVLFFYDQAKMDAFVDERLCDLNGQIRIHVIRTASKRTPGLLSRR